MNVKKISIKTEYIEEIEKILQHSGQFNSPEEYINFILHELLFANEKETSPQDDEQINKRLKDLGYL